MIMVWKKDAGASQFTAKWNGSRYVLKEVVVVSGSRQKRWHLYADGQHVKQTWYTSRSAMDTIEVMQQRLIMQAARPTAVPSA